MFSSGLSPSSTFPARLSCQCGLLLAAVLVLGGCVSPVRQAQMDLKAAEARAAQQIKARQQEVSTSLETLTETGHGVVVLQTRGQFEDRLGGESPLYGKIWVSEIAGWIGPPAARSSQPKQPTGAVLATSRDLTAGALETLRTPSTFTADTPGRPVPIVLKAGRYWMRDLVLRHDDTPRGNRFRANYLARTIAPNPPPVEFSLAPGEVLNLGTVFIDAKIGDFGLGERQTFTYVAEVREDWENGSRALQETYPQLAGAEVRRVFACGGCSVPQ